MMKMRMWIRRFLEALWTIILTLLVILTFSFTVYLCVEFFGIVDIPEKYSLINFLDSKLEATSSVKEYIATLEGKNIKDIIEQVKEDSITVELDTNTVTVVQLQDENYQTETTNNTLSFKYYDQLDEYGKVMYDGLNQNKEKLKTGNHVFYFGNTFDELLHQENGDEILNQSFQLAVNAFSFDHPEIFYIDITKIYLLTEITTTPFKKTYNVSIGPNGDTYLYDEYLNQESIDLAVGQIHQIKETIKQTATGSDYEKIKYVHDYLVENIEYEKTVNTHNNYSIYGSLINKKAVCEGYAKAFKYILDEMEIPTFIVCGTATNSDGITESHAWNYVEIDNNLYAVDVTWDDPIIVGNGRITDNIKYKYFLKGGNKFFEDHVEDGTIIETAKFTYPKISNLDY